MKILKKELFEIKTYETSNISYFCAKDIANSLGYNDGKKAIQNVVRKKYKKPLTEIFDIFNSDQQLLSYNCKNSMYLTKYGLVEILIKSKQPNKEDFIKWCTINFKIDCDVITYLGKEQEYIGYIIKAFKHKKSKPQYYVDNYRVDLYFIQENIVIECDEFNHIDRDPEYEKLRHKHIKNKLKCKFVRFNPDAKDFCIFTIINQIMKLMDI